MSLDAVILQGVSSSALYRSLLLEFVLVLCWEGTFFFIICFSSLLSCVFPSLPGTAQTPVSELCL